MKRRSLLAGGSLTALGFLSGCLDSESGDQENRTNKSMSDRGGDENRSNLNNDCNNSIDSVMVNDRDNIKEKYIYNFNSIDIHNKPRIRNVIQEAVEEESGLGSTHGLCQTELETVEEQLGTFQQKELPNEEGGEKGVYFRFSGHIIWVTIENNDS